MMERVTIVGAGKWGTALAAAVCQAGRQVTLVSNNEGHAKAINVGHENARHLPGILLDARIHAAAKVTEPPDILLIVTPAQQVRTVAARLAPKLPTSVPVVLCAKGIELKTGLLMPEVVAEALPDATPVVLSGPTFATEVARGLPAALTLACADRDLGEALVAALSSNNFRIYHSTDATGAALAGAVKNVIAIACGIVVGRGLGENACAAVMTRGLAEITRLGIALGAVPQTFQGLAGVGDLSLSCTSASSRNFALGLALGEGRSLDQATEGGRVLAEGVFTASAVLARASQAKVEMPISAAVDGVVKRGADIDETIAKLLSRPSKAEHADTIARAALTRH